MRTELIDCSRRAGAIDAAAPRHVAIGLVTRGSKVVRDLTAHVHSLDHDKIESDMRVLVEIGSDCHRAINQNVQELSALLEAKEALDCGINVSSQFMSETASRCTAHLLTAPHREHSQLRHALLLIHCSLYAQALVDCRARNADVSKALMQLQQFALGSEAKMDELGSVLLALDELVRILHRVHCEDINLLRLAQAVLSQAALLPSAASVWDELRSLPERLEPVTTSSLLSSSVAMPSSSEGAPFSVVERCHGEGASSGGHSASALLLRSLKSLSVAPSALEFDLSTSRSLVNLAPRAWRGARAPIDTSMQSPTSSALRDAVAELRARCDLRPRATADALHPLVELACCRTSNACGIVGALGRLPFVASRTPSDYELTGEGDDFFSTALQADLTAGGARGAFPARIGDHEVMIKSFPFAGGHALLQEVAARQIIGSTACASIEAAFVHNNAVWLQVRSTSRGSLLDVTQDGEPLCRSWPESVRLWRTLDTFRTLIGIVRSAHQAGLALGGALAPEHLIIDSRRSMLLLTSLWRSQMVSASAESGGTRAELTAFADDMYSFGRCLFSALFLTAAPDHPQQIEMQLATLADQPTRELLSALLSGNAERRLSAADCMLDKCFVGMADRMRTCATIVGVEHRKHVWTAHARCLNQLASANGGALRILATRANVVNDVLLKFSALRSTDDLLKPLYVSFGQHERIATDQGGITRELMTTLFERLRADAERGVENRLLDVGSGATSSGAVFLPSPTASPQQCEALGRVLLKMLLLGLQCPLRLAPSLVKALSCSEEELTLQDLEVFDSQAALTLGSLSKASCAELEQMDLAFSAAEDPGRVDERVTVANVAEFIKAKVAHLLERSRVVQVERMVWGFRSVPTLDPHLDLLGSAGITELLFDSAWRTLDPRLLVSSLCWQDWPPESTLPARLAECLCRLSQDKLRLFLRLATGSVVMPTGGFSPPITIQRCPPSSALPVGSTCFHVVRMPDYADPDELEAKMTMALDHCGMQDMGYV